MVEGLNEDDNPVVFQCYWKKDLLNRIEEILQQPEFRVKGGKGRFDRYPANERGREGTIER